MARKNLKDHYTHLQAYCTSTSETEPHCGALGEHEGEITPSPHKKSRRAGSSNKISRPISLRLFQIGVDNIKEINDLHSTETDVSQLLNATRGDFTTIRHCVACGMDSFATNQAINSMNKQAAFTYLRPLRVARKKKPRTRLRRSMHLRRKRSRLRL